MDVQKPTTGGVVAVLYVIAGMEIVGAFFGGAAANLSVGAEVIVMISAAVFAVLLCAAAAVVQELRNISFNTRKKPSQSSPSPVPAVTPSANIDEAEAMRAYGIVREGDKFRFRKYLYGNLVDAVNYARRSPPEEAPDFF